MSIKIPVSANFDSTQMDAEVQKMTQKFNSLGQAAASLGDVKFNPIDKATMRDMDEMSKRFEALQKMAPGLQKRLQDAGQGGKGWHEVDWKAAFPNDHQRTRYMHTLVNTLRDNSAKSIKPTNPPANPGAPSHGQSDADRGPSPAAQEAKRQAANIGRSALGGLGGAGNAVSGSIGTFGAMGAGAGLIGLLGGLGALGVAKLVGGATQNIGVAEDDNVGYDRLKRALGDVSVSFEHLKGTVRASSDQFHATWQESQQLASNFAQLGNVTRENYKDLAGEVGVGGGLARALGLDPTQGVSLLGQLRGVGQTSNLEDSRRMALLIGDAIGQSGTFAKAGQVMDAIGNYASQQSRQSLGSANVAGYAGLLSGLMGAGIPGLDPAGSAQLISSVNASLSAGGAHGEASQFFTQGLGSRMGLNPFETQVLREGGAMSTLDESFGPGSMAYRFGMPGPRGDQTLLESTLSELRNQYGNDPGMLANATSNHLGIGMRQAMAMLMIDPKQMGGIQERLRLSGFNMTDLNASGISSLSSIEYGSDEDRQAIANDLFGRGGRDRLSEDDRARLNEAMSGGDTNEIKNVLSRLVASRDQEQTQGKDIRDSKNALENLKTAVADKLVPLTQDMRAGILFMAGDGKKTGSEVLQDIADRESDIRSRRINNEFDVRQDEMREKYRADFGDASPSSVRNAPWYSEFLEKKKSGNMTPEDEAHYNQLFREFDQANTMKAGPAGQEMRIKMRSDYFERRDQVEKEREAALEKEDERRKAEKARIEAADKERSEYENERQRLITESAANDQRVPATPASTPEASSSGRASGSMRGNAALREAVAREERRIGAPEGFLWAQMGQESSYNPNAVSKAGAQGLAQIMPTTVKAWEKRKGRSFDPFNPMDAVKLQGFTMEENYNRFGSWDDAARAYNGGWDKSRWGNPETQGYVPAIRGRMGEGTTMPADLARSERQRQQQVQVSMEPLVVRHEDTSGRPMRPPETLQPTVTQPRPFGMAQ